MAHVYMDPIDVCVCVHDIQTKLNGKYKIQ